MGEGGITLSNMIKKEKQIKLNLPWPPSVNSLYRINGKGKRAVVFKAKKAVAYANTVGWELKRRKIEGFGTSRVEIDIQAYPPDRRRRDLDNIQKALLDSLQQAGVYQDDCQVDKITIARGPAVPEGMVVIDIKEIGL